MTRPVVFLGPSLAREAAQEVLDADYRPPVRRGDVDALAADPPPMVGIIDGLFFQSLAVSPKEILPLLRRGVRVYGASSMGALRAAELASYGMIGVGRIFGLFASGALDADDEVAMLYAPDGHSPLTEPLVNIRHVLELAVERGIIPRAAALKLVRRMRRLHFTLRGHRQLLALARGYLGATAAEQLGAFLPAAPDLKQLDALELVRTMARDAALTAPDRPCRTA
jgi:hypothetical protein